MLTNVDYMTMTTPLGDFLIAARDDALKGAWFIGQKYYPDVSEANGWHERQTPVLKQAVAQMQEYFGGQRRDFDVPMAPEGTAFQEKVWQALLTIAGGQTSTYGRIAEDIASKDAAQAVGAAVGQNPISIMIPCHRVLGSNGSLTGYAGGLDRKRWLLAHESPAGDLFGQAG